MIDRPSAIATGINIVDRYYKKMCYLYSLPQYMPYEDLQDMKHECVLEMILAIDRYKDGPATIKTFLTHRVKGFFIDFLRGRTRRKKLEDELAMLDQPDEVLPAEIMFNVSKQELLVGISKLPPLQATIIEQHFLLGKSVETVAEELGYCKSSGWIYRLIKDALRRLEITLNSEEK